MVTKSLPRLLHAHSCPFLPMVLDQPCQALIRLSPIGSKRRAPPSYLALFDGPPADTQRGRINGARGHPCGVALQAIKTCSWVWPSKEINLCCDPQASNRSLGIAAGKPSSTGALAVISGCILSNAEVQSSVAMYPPCFVKASCNRAAQASALSLRLP